MEFSLRPALESDYELVRFLHEITLRPYVEPLFGWDENEPMPHFWDHFRSEGARVIVVDRVDVGWLLFIESEESIYLSQIFILPDFQGQGIGSQLLVQLKERSRSVDKPLVLGVLKNNPAKRLYERHRFVVLWEEVHKYVLQWQA